MKQHDTGHKDRAILWGMLVGPPGTRKSPVLNEVIQPLEEIEEKWRREDEPTWRTYRAAHAQWEKTGRKNGEPEPKQPRRRRKAVNDTTTEALAPILSDNPDGVISYRDELSGWVGDMDAYRPGKAASKDQAFG
ncbi:MAG: DUF3987 domain-containing protein [Xanthobacteraceae bacterium]